MIPDTPEFAVPLLQVMVFASAIIIVFLSEPALCAFIAKRSSSSLNSKGVAFASFLPSVGLFFSGPR